MRARGYAATAAVAILGVVSDISGLMNDAGMDVSGIQLLLANNSVWITPVAAIIVGFAIGWKVREWAMRNDGVGVEKVEELVEARAKAEAELEALKEELARAKSELAATETELRAAKARLHAAGIKTDGGLYGELVKASERFEKNNGIKPAS